MGKKRAFARLLRVGADPIIDLVYPPRCPACGDAIGAQNGLCQSCWSDLAIPTEPACKACQRPFGENGAGEGSLCLPCLHALPEHDGIAAGTLYTDTSRKLVLSLKHGGRIGLAPVMAGLVAARVPAGGPGRLIVPVPLHRWRLWKRGFNQAALLARGLEKRGCGTLVVDLLQRAKPTESLGGKGKREREKILTGAIAVSQRGKQLVKGRDVLLVDDVLTSGATSSACVRALKRSGARSVVIACFARVLDEALDHAA